MKCVKKLYLGMVKGKRVRKEIIYEYYTISQNGPIGQWIYDTLYLVEHVIMLSTLKNHYALTKNVAVAVAKMLLLH